MSVELAQAKQAFRNVFKPEAWQSLWPSALLETMAATLLSVVVIGIQFVPDEIRRLREAPAERAKLCVPLHEGNVVASLIESIDAQLPLLQRHKALRWYDTRDSGSLQDTLKLSNDANCLAFDASGRRLFVGHASGVLKVLRPGKKSVRGSELLGHVSRGGVFDMACSPDGKILLTLDIAGLAAWNIDLSSRDYGRPNWYLMEKYIECFAVYPDWQAGLIGLSSNSGSRLVEFNLRTGDLNEIVQLPDKLLRVVISADGLDAALVHDSDTISLLGRQSAQSPWQSQNIPGMRTCESMLVAFSPASNLLVTSECLGRHLIAWDLERKESRRLFESPSEALTGCRFLNNDRMVVWGLENKLHILSLGNSSVVQEVEL